MHKATTRLRGFFWLGKYGPINELFTPDDLARLEQMVDLYLPPQSPDTFAAHPDAWRDADVIIPTWGCPPLSPAMIAAAPRLQAIFHVGGSTKFLVTPDVVARNIAVCSTYAAGAVPVAEFALAHVLFGLKSGWQHVMVSRELRAYKQLPRAGAYGSVVGILSLGVIGRTLVDLLKQTSVRVIAYDPFVTPEQAATLGVELCSLEDVFRRAAVVSVHTPWLPETEGMITGAHLASMQPYSTFINTARGAVVREQEMIAVLQRRPDLVAVLDVTHPEPSLPDSPLYTLPNVVLTPHIAGAHGTHESLLMGRYAVEEIARCVAGQPLRWRIKPEQAARLA